MFILNKHYTFKQHIYHPNHLIQEIYFESFTLFRCINYNRYHYKELWNI